MELSHVKAFFEKSRYAIDNPLYVNSKTQNKASRGILGKFFDLYKQTGLFLLVPDQPVNQVIYLMQSKLIKLLIEFFWINHATPDIFQSIWLQFNSHTIFFWDIKR